MRQVPLQLRRLLTPVFLGAIALLALGLSAPGLLAPAARADGEPAGEFDYYVLSLSWNPSWCAVEGDGRGAPECDGSGDYGFTLHGLWPQYEEGWPQYCRTRQVDPSRRETAAMADIMGSGGLAWHEWRKHGRCTGLSPVDYFRLSREAYDRVVRPEIFRRLPREVALPPHVVEEAFLEANPGLAADGVTITCRDGYVKEARICLTRSLEPRDCAPDTRRDCRASSILMPPVR